jgi:hypothetical protein
MPGGGMLMIIAIKMINRQPSKFAFHTSNQHSFLITPTFDYLPIYFWYLFARYVAAEERS